MFHAGRNDERKKSPTPLLRHRARTYRRRTRWTGTQALPLSLPGSWGTPLLQSGDLIISRTAFSSDGHAARWIWVGTSMTIYRHEQTAALHRVLVSNYRDNMSCVGPATPPSSPSPAAVDKPAPVWATTMGAPLSIWASLLDSVRSFSFEIASSAPPHRPL